LKTLFLSSNQLTGTIPVSFNTLINLNYLDLRDNLLCKKADFDYSIWPIIESRYSYGGFFSSTSWQEQLETFPICEAGAGNDENDEIVAQTATDCNAVTEISPAECESLLELYHSTEGAHWVNNEGWNVTNTPCRWYGITCENHGVTKIDLSINNQLIGTIPNFSALPNLEWLDLHLNQLTGTIPNFDALPNLKWLDLSYNQLTGTIPHFSALPHLELLSLHSNQLTGTIPNFSALPNLRNLYLSSNQLTGTIPNFSALPNLELLQLDSNRLTGTIPDFSALHNLRNLYLNSNQLTGIIPVSSNALINLNYFDLRYNSLCKKADFDYSVWLIKQSRYDDETTWQAQLETFPICEAPTDDNSPLRFIELKESYQIDEIVEVRIEVHFTAKNPTDTVDLWIAVQMPSTDFLYITPLPSANLFSPEPQFFKYSLSTTEDTFSVISDLQVPAGIGGNYTFYAALIETGKNPWKDGMQVIRHIEQASTLLSNR
jgi:hypothetical protein